MWAWKGSLTLASSLTWTTFHRSPLRSINEPCSGTDLSPSMSRSISSVVGSPLYRNTICLAGFTVPTLCQLDADSNSCGTFETKVADQHSRDMGLEQVVQPGRAGPFFKGHMQAAAQTVDKLQNRCGF